MRSQPASEIVIALSAECEALRSLKPIYEAEKNALVQNKPEVLVELSASKVKALDELRSAISKREDVFTKLGVVTSATNAAIIFVNIADAPAQRLWQDIRALKHTLSVLHRVVASLLKSRRTAVERALAILVTSRNGRELYDQSGSAQRIVPLRSGIAI